jgi:hypothetical protein
MVVIVHQAKRIEQSALLADFFGEKVDKKRPILVIEKDRFAAIPPGGEVIQSASKFQAKRAGHGGEIRSTGL